jgi:hypothetical protein
MIVAALPDLEQLDNEALKACWLSRSANNVLKRTSHIEALAAQHLELDAAGRTSASWSSRSIAA